MPLVLRSSWTRGPEREPSGPVLVEVTVFAPAVRRDLPGIFRAGMRLREGWPELHGAVGMWLWTRPFAGTCGSVSVWRDRESLMSFVVRPDHLDVVRRYRQRGNLTSSSWHQAWQGPEPLWRRAASRLGPGVAPPSR